MKKTFKKALSVLIVAVMVFGSAPLAGFVGIELPEFNLFGTKADAETSGYYTYFVIFYDEVSFYGEAIIVDVDESISGCITIPSNIDGFTITGINDYAFGGCTGLTSVTIPDSVMRIGDYAFDGCTGLTSVTIPDSVTIIGDSSFSNCTGLTTITIPDSVTNISNSAFYGCTGLTNVTIPDSVTSIGEYAFSCCCGLTSVTIPDSVTSISNDAFYYCTGLTSVTIPDSVTSIGDYAFNWCNNLSTTYYTGTPEQWNNISIGFNDGNISENIIFECNSERPYYLGSCGENLTWTLYTDGELVIEGTGDMTDYSSYSNVPWYSKRAKIKSVTISDGITSIGNYAFRDCTELTNITIPDSLTSIGSYAFYWCTGLTSVTIPDSVIRIGDYALYYCTGLTSVHYTGDIAGWCSFDFNTPQIIHTTNLYIRGKKVEGDLVIPDGVTSIGDYAFFGFKGLTSVTIPDSATSIGHQAFDYCDNLSTTYYTGTPEQWNNISIGSNNGTISKNIVFECNSERPYYVKGTCGENLTWTLCADGELLIKGTGDMTDYSSSTNAPWYSKRSIIKSVIIDNGVTSIGDCAFYNCTELTGVEISDSVTNIGKDAFCNAGIYNDSSNWENDVLYIGNHLIKAKTTLSGNYTINAETKAIAEYAFFGCTKLTSVTVPDSVTSIGNYAFSGCNNIETTYYTGTPEQWSEISIGSNNGVISKNIVFECNSERPYYGKGTCGDNLTWILYTDGELVIDGTGDMTDYSSYSNVPWYSKSSKIKSVTIPDGITSIGDYAFYSCGFTSITIPDSVTSIGNYAFSDCTGLTSVTIPDSVTSIGNYAFSDCTGLTSVTIPDSVTGIGDAAFNYCNNLSTTYYTRTQEQWKNISIGSNNGAISRNIVFECNSERPYYEKGTCGENLTWILYTDGELIIEGTGEMTDYSSYSNVPWYSNRSKIKSVTILDGITSIGNYAFYSCGFTSITIPNGVTSVGDYSFFGCTGLTSLSVSESVTQIGCFAFAGCNNLKKIEFLGYTTSIADDSFQNCPNVVIYCKSGSSIQSFAERNSLMYALTDGEYSDVIIKNNQLVSYQGDSASPKISSGITSIGSNAFKDNSTVKTVELPNSVSSIYSGAFSNCSSLERIVVPHTVTTIAPDAFSGTNTTIVCYANSYAHQYAVEKGMNFELISVTLNQTKAILSVGEYSIITATPEQEYLDSVQTSWKSSDTVVATVDANGKVTALSNGTATIYALAPTGETLATCSVQVGYSFGVTIQNPSTKTISYKSGIILHATADNLPAGAKIVWEKDNDNFSMSDDGNGNCTIVSKANGSTTFTAKVKLADGSIAKDSNGNEISAQVTMNSKAGFFDKIVAFFKGLFGGNKILPQLFKVIF